MTLAEQKKNENIAEYVIYMWQMEDLIRAANFNDEVITHFVREFTEDPIQMEEELNWFRDLMKSMKQEKLERKGHIAEVVEVMNELAMLHHTLVNILKDSSYLLAYKDAKPNIGEYLQKAGGTMNNDVETCLTALYGLLVLRLKKTEISPETEEAMKTFSSLMAVLSVEYKKMKTGEMNLGLN